mgnify:CR=1 FL=1
MSDFIKNNPVWFIASFEAIVAIALNLVLAFGVTVTMEQTALINALVLSILTLGLGLWAQKPIERLIEKRVAAQLELERSLTTCCTK